MERTPDSKDLLLTIEETCKALRVSRAQLYVLFAQEELVCIHLSPRAPRVPMEDLKEFLVRKKQEALGKRKAALG